MLCTYNHTCCCYCPCRRTEYSKTLVECRTKLLSKFCKDLKYKLKFVEWYKCNKLSRQCATLYSCAKVRVSRLTCLSVCLLIPVMSTPRAVQAVYPPLTLLSVATPGNFPPPAKPTATVNILDLCYPTLSIIHCSRLKGTFLKKISF